MHSLSRVPRAESLEREPGFKSGCTGLRSECCHSLPVTVGRLPHHHGSVWSSLEQAIPVPTVGHCAGNVGDAPRSPPAAAAGLVPGCPPGRVVQCLWLTHPPSPVSFACVPEPACRWGGPSSQRQVPLWPQFTHRVQQVPPPGGRDSWSFPAGGWLGHPEWGSGHWGATCLKETGVRGMAEASRC